MAKMKTGASDPHEERYRLKIRRRMVFSTVAWAAAGVIITVLLLNLWPRWGLSGRAGCMNNLRQIGLALTRHALENDGDYPESLGVLLKDGELSTAKVFVCPSQPSEMPEHFPWDFREADLSVLNSVETWGSYVLVKGLRRAGDPNVIILHDKPGAHGGKGRNCFFDDGHVEWLAEAEFLKRMKEQKARLGEMPAPPRVRGETGR